MAEERTLLQVALEDRPGSLAEAAAALGGAGIDIEAVLGYTAGEEAAAQLVVADAEAARAALEGAGYRLVAERTVFLVPIEDRPGALGELTGRLAADGLNLFLVYLATRGRLLLGAQDEVEARRLLG